MKKNYIIPEITVTEIESENILAGSGTGGAEPENCILDDIDYDMENDNIKGD